MHVVAAQQRLGLVPGYHQETDSATDGEKSHHGDDREPHLDSVSNPNAQDQADDLNAACRHLTWHPLGIGRTTAGARLPA